MVTSDRTCTKGSRAVIRMQQALLSARQPQVGPYMQSKPLAQATALTTVDAVKPRERITMPDSSDLYIYHHMRCVTDLRDAS